MMRYAILEKDNVPDVLKNKPRWLSCVIVAATILAITTSAVAAGAVIGYTYCYLEHRVHRHGMTAGGNLTHTTNFQILHVPIVETEKNKKNKTINSALSSVLVSRILKVGHAIFADDTANLPWAPEMPEFIHPLL